MHLEPAPLIALQRQTLRISKIAPTLMPAYIQTPAQWEDLRPFITKLYMEGGLKLPEVMREVEKTHGLKANPGMFKKRFDKWGLTKHLKKAEVEMILRIARDRELLGNKTSFKLRGHEVDMVNIERYRKRNHIQIPDDPVDESDMEKFPDLEVSTPPTSPASSTSEPGSLMLTPPSSSDSLSPLSLPTFIAAPTILGHCEEYLKETSFAFECSPSGFWTISQSTEMPWSPGRVEPQADPVIAEWYYQDECFRHLNNGVLLFKEGDMKTAFKEWNEAFSLIEGVVKAAHYNTLLKLLSCIHLLDHEQHSLVAERFRVWIGLWAEKVLAPDHLYKGIYRRLKDLPAENIEELQLRTQELLVKKLETSLGEEAFTSFEHKMVLNEKKLVNDPSLHLDAMIPTNDQCRLLYGPTSSKTMLALNMRNGVLQYRGMQEEAYETILMIIKNASMVEDPAVRLWHLVSAWLSLARLQSDFGQVQAMRLSLKNAYEAEQELRGKYGLVKLGQGELNWIAEKLGWEPMFRAVEIDELDIGAMSLS